MQSPQVSLEQLYQAWSERSPKFIELVVEFCQQPEPAQASPLPNNDRTFSKFFRALESSAYRRLSPQQRAHYRQEYLKSLEAPDSDQPATDYWRVHELLTQLWQSEEPVARETLSRLLAVIPLRYGVWKGIKRIFKEAEAKNDTEIYGLIAARLDAAWANPKLSTIRRTTLGYCVRRAWRYLRRVAAQFPALYADVATDFLIHYPADCKFQATWIANHIFHHSSGSYGRAHFRDYQPNPPSSLKDRAYPELWRRSLRPLLVLLEQAQADPIRKYAIAAIKADFPSALNDLSPIWLTRWVLIPSAPLHDFIVWILKTVPKFQLSALRELGLHNAIFQLFDSPSSSAASFAASYARVHARDLPIEMLIRLADHQSRPVRELAHDLLCIRDPRTEVGLERWSRLLETDAAHTLAAEMITKHFGRQELTLEWFQTIFATSHKQTFNFARQLLAKLYPDSTLGSTFYLQLLRNYVQKHQMNKSPVINWALQQLQILNVNTIPEEELRWLALFPLTANVFDNWLKQGTLHPHTVGISFLKLLAYHPHWDSDPWLAAFRAQHGSWAETLAFNQQRSKFILDLMADPQLFSNTDLTLDWLIELVARPEPIYHNFATQRLLKTFSPADFAPSEVVSPTDGPAANSATVDQPQVVDLQKASFVFTGTLTSMTRAEAEARVKAANGIVWRSVTPQLHYLVVGDQASRRFKQKVQGSPQLRAEELNANGANIRIISEAQFCQMLSISHPASPGDNATLAGCEQLWRWLLLPGPTATARGQVAINYIRQHYPPLRATLTQDPLNKELEIPTEFLSWERIRPLFRESRRPLRELALELAQFELARWAPSIDDIIELAESPFRDVRCFMSQALLADDSLIHQAYRLDPAQLTPSAAYRFCESTNQETRRLGMEIIRRVPRFQVPEELFRLTESPDRQIRAFVIRTLWDVYRQRGLTEGWKPAPLPQPTTDKRALKTPAPADRDAGPGVPTRPTTWPADQPSLATFLRRILFELPPGPPERDSIVDTENNKASASTGSASRSRSPQRRPLALPARRAKLATIEVLRDFAVENREFGQGILPLLEEFMQSHGVSEREACMVAITRICHHHGLPTHRLR